MIDLTVIIVTYNSAKDIGPCLEALFQTKGSLELDVFVVDNASQDRTMDIVRYGHPNVHAIAMGKNEGFPAANNVVLPLASGRYVLLLNPDTVVLPGALSTLVDFMDRATDCGICGPTLIDGSGVSWPDLRVPSFWYILQISLGLAGLFRQNSTQRSVEALSGACLLLRRSLVHELGLLDESLFWCEDVDYCLRARSRGYRVCAVRESRVVHYVGRSAKANIGLVIENQYTSRLRFFIKNRPAMETRCVWLLLSAQALARLAKWGILGRLRPSPDARSRIYALRRALREMPKILWGETD